MRPIAFLPLLALLAAPLLAADSPASAPTTASPAATQAAKPLLQIRVAYNGPLMDLGEGKTGFMVMDVDESAPLESHVTSVEISHAQESPAQDEKGRLFTCTNYYIRLHLDAAGTAEVTRMLKLAKESDKRDNGREGAPRVTIDDSTVGSATLFPHEGKKTAELRLVVSDKQLLALAAAVKQNWKPDGTTPAYDWNTGKLPPTP